MGCYGYSLGRSFQLVDDILDQDGYVKIQGIEATKNQAQDFYAIHKGKAFYDDLCEFMSSGPIIVLILEKENAVEEYRKLIGATNPDEANENTVRKLYGKSKSYNAVHGSDSIENGIIEIGYFFAESELVNNMSGEFIED